MRQLSLFEDPTASPLKNFTIYRSSAGSGKTFTLVKEYLKIVLRNPQDYQHVLAITFTNKAAENMKSRILNDLRDMAAGRPSDMWVAIEEEVQHFPQKLDIQRRASKVLSNILHNYSRFAISTIDHFFSQLVRSLARELRLNLNYEIDVDEDAAMEQSIQGLYEVLHQQSELLEWIKEFAFSRIDQDRGWQLDYNLLEFGKELFKEKFHQGFSKLSREEVNLQTLRELEQQLKRTQRNYERTQKEHAREALGIMRTHGLRVEDFKYKSTSAASTFNKILEADFELKIRFKNTVAGYEDWFMESSMKRKQIEAALNGGLENVAREILDYHEKHYPEYITARELQRHIYSYGLLEALSEQLKIYRQQNNIMLLSHNSFLLREIMGDHEAPFLFEKLGSYYHHVLIDEFQDTSIYQWKNVKPLASNALDQQNHVLLVGDAKQSIYRWRGGDLDLLLRKAKQDLSLYQEQLEERTLLKNRRSSRSVIEFNNAFFTMASSVLLNTEGLPDDSGMLSQVYREVVQEVHEPGLGGVHIRFVEKTDREWWEPSLQALLEVIQEQTHQGARYGDMMILVYKNEEVTIISEYLAQKQIPVISAQALRLSNNWAVRLLISGLYLWSDPHDNLARAEMAYLYQKGNLSAEVDFREVFQQAMEQKTGLLEVFLPGDFCQQWTRLTRKNVYEWAAEVVPLLLGTHSNPFLERFLEICHEQGKNGVFSPHDFLRWWEKNKHLQTAVSPGNQDAVQVMTIHKAKGLEAPIVIVPRADFDLKPRHDSIFWTDQLTEAYQKYKLVPLSFNKDLLESHFAGAYQQELLEGLIEGLNVAYVAFTRARDKLYVISLRPGKNISPGDLGTINKLLWHVCSDPFWGDRWNSTAMTLTVGSLLDTKMRGKEEIQPSEPIVQLRSMPYQGKVRIRSDAHKFFLLLDHHKAAKVREGIKMHAILEKLTTREDLPLVIQGLWTQGLLANGDLQPLQEKIEALFNHPQFSSWFDPSWKVFTEREIMSQGQRYKPDRVVIKDARAIVIDYKREQEDPSHQRQVTQYGQLLETIGYTSVDKFLVYIDEMKIVSV